MTTKPLPLSSPEDAVVTWIKQQAIPITSLNPDAPLEDLLPLAQIVGSATIVGLGEASHGAHEFFVMKHRLVKFLVEHMGFTMFAMEMEWSSAALLNEYVLHGVGDARNILKNQTTYKLWKTQEVLDVIEWIRAYNAHPEHTKKVQFAGIDMVAMQKPTIDQIVNYVQSIDTQLGIQIAELYSSIPLFRPSVWPDQATLQRNLEASSQVFTLLKDHEAVLVSQSTPQFFARMLQEVCIVEQFCQIILAFDQSQSTSSSKERVKAYELRDLFMAENVGWLHEHAEEKIVVWAHNWHIGTSDYWCCDPHSNNDPFIWMGAHLRRSFQETYRQIGFSFFEGSHNSYQTDEQGEYISQKWLPVSVKPATAGSYNHMLSQAGTHYLLDLRQFPEGEISAWFNGNHPFRVFDTDYFSDESRFYHCASLPKWFDAIIEIHEITPSILLE